MVEEKHYRKHKVVTVLCIIIGTMLGVCVILLNCYLARKRRELVRDHEALILKQLDDPEKALLENSRPLDKMDTGDDSASTPRVPEHLY